jgi:hypothetical protein
MTGRKKNRCNLFTAGFFLAVVNKEEILIYDGFFGLNLAIVNNLMYDVCSLMVENRRK